MKQSRWGGDIEYIQDTKWSNRALGQLILTNLPPGAEDTIDNRVITPTVTELVRLTGVEFKGLPPLTIEDMIGPTKISELDPNHQAFYFSGPMHPILVRARKLPTFVTYSDILNVRGQLGITSQTATENFRGLVKNLFEDEEMPTFGEPDRYSFEDKDAGNIPRLHRFAVRRSIAQLAMRGEYKVGISGTRNTNVFSGYGRALIREIYNDSARRQHMDLLMELEAMPNLITNVDDPNCFYWNKIYKDIEGIGYDMRKDNLSIPLGECIKDLLVEIGAITDKDWWGNYFISEDAFTTIVTKLCPLDTKHTKSIKAGNSCSQGMHHKALTKRSVQRAQSIAACINEAKLEVKPAEHEDDELNLLDPDLSADTSRSKRALPKPDW